MGEVTVHALRGAILPVVSFSGPALAFLITGTVVVERMFAIPGLGAYFIDAANNRDHFLILAIANALRQLLRARIEELVSQLKLLNQRLTAESEETELIVAGRVLPLGNS